GSHFLVARPPHTWLLATKQPAPSPPVSRILPPGPPRRRSLPSLPAIIWLSPLLPAAPSMPEGRLSPSPPTTFSTIAAFLRNTGLASSRREVGLASCGVCHTALECRPAVCTAFDGGDMKVRTILAALLACLMTVPWCFAQEAFTGTWKLNEAKS